MPTMVKPKATRLVVSERDARQRRLARADRVPSRRDQVHRLAQRRKLHRPVRIVGQDRLAGRGHGAIDHPVVAALLGREAHRSDGLSIDAQDVAR